MTNCANAAGRSSNTQALGLTREAAKADRSWALWGVVRHREGQGSPCAQLALSPPAQALCSPLLS